MIHFYAYPCALNSHLLENPRFVEVWENITVKVMYIHVICILRYLLDIEYTSPMSRILHHAIISCFDMALDPHSLV